MYSNESGLRNKFTAYLGLVVKHGKVDYLRIIIRRRRREELYDSLPEDLADNRCAAMPPDGYGFQHALLDRAYDTLSDTRQKILACFFVHKMTAKEIASLYGYTEAYVYKLKYKSLEQLRSYIISHSQRGDGDIE